MKSVGRKKIKLAEYKDKSYFFDKSIDYELPHTDFDGCRFEGILKDITLPFSGNFRSCILQNLTCEKFDFNIADLLDCQIANCTFNKSNFDTSHLAGCYVRESAFLNLKITNINFSQNVFHKTRFINCTFDTFVFKSCKFYECEFIDCTSKNHTFDTCFFDETNFHNFELLPSTILINVGINLQNLSKPRYRDKRKKDNGKIVDLKEFMLALDAGSSGLQERLSIAFFKSNDIHEYIREATLILETNIQVSRAISKGFIEKLELLVMFFNFLYAEDKLLAVNLLQLQDHLNKLAENLKYVNDKYAIQFSREIDSLRLVNSDYVASIVRNIDHVYTVLYGAEMIALLANEHLGLDDYKKLFAENENIKIIECRERNSPIALFVQVVEAGALMWLISAIVTTRFFYQVDGISTIDYEQNEALEEAAKNISSNNYFPVKQKIDKSKLIASRTIEIGLLSKENIEIGVRVATAFQSGLCKKYEVNFSPKRVVQFQKNIISILGYYKRDN